MNSSFEMPVEVDGDAVNEPVVGALVPPSVTVRMSPRFFAWSRCEHWSYEKFPRATQQRSGRLRARQ